LINPAADGACEWLPASESAAACAEIACWPGYALTPLCALRGLARTVGVGAIWYKDEGYRFGLGSFKALGGAYAVLRALQSEVATRRGRIPSSSDLRGTAFRQITEAVTVTTATDGNHGRSVAWGAQMFGCRSVVYVPASCSAARAAAICSYGAQVVRTETAYDGAVRQCAEDARRFGRVVISDTAWNGYTEVPRTVMHGYTLAAKETAEQFPAGVVPTHVFIQAGCGGFAAAAFSCLQAQMASKPRFIVVEPETAACVYASAHAGKLAPAEGNVHSIMAGLDCGEASLVAWRILSRGADAFMTVPDSVTAQCMRLLAFAPYGDRPIVAGESAIAGLAALLLANRDAQTRAALGLSSESIVLLFGSEGATDPEIYERIVGRSGSDLSRGDKSRLR
jgi:diaminopropionate ammonia-lyase